MKLAAWGIGLVVGLSGCGGAVVGGDAPAQGGGAMGGSAGGNFTGKNAGVGGGADQDGASTGSELLPSCDSTIDAWIAFDAVSSELPSLSIDSSTASDLYLTRPDGSQLTRLTDDPATEKEPCFSPTGDRLSFTSNRSGLDQIYIMDLQTRTVKQVTSGGGDQSSFSADGKLLTFHRGVSVFTIEPDGSNETSVAVGLDAINGYSRPRFIGNDQLVFDRNYEIDAINLDKTNFRSLLSNDGKGVGAPTVSPQENELAYEAWCLDDEDASIWTTSISISASTGACRGQRVTPAQDPLLASHLSWGPGDTFAYERYDGHTKMAHLTLINRAPGSVPCSLNTDTQNGRNPSWSAEGLRISPPP